MGLFGPGFRGLDLTDAQREQVQAIMQSHQAEFKQVGEKMRTARDGMHALVNADALDEAAIRAKATEVATAEADAAILNAKVRAEVKGVLTAEQLQKMKEFQAERQERRGQVAERGKGRRQMRRQAAL
jgi:Spy/CpxP family protein refolding chaperone